MDCDSILKMSQFKSVINLVLCLLIVAKAQEAQEVQEAQEAQNVEAPKCKL